ncbi:MAG: diguanylate cyclase [Proteobacteria bacterium]|nr:MAG: diguanylate cyclase [Pseudomonadota bacterium]
MEPGTTTITAQGVNEATQETGTAGSLRILIADDERVSRTLMMRVVESWGYQAVEAESGDTAWAILSAPNPPRIAIIDWMMPGIDGVEICRRLHNRTDAPLIYTILLTSKTDEQALVHALEQGAHDFQTKPANPGELRARLLVGRRLVESDDRLNESLARMEQMAATDSLTGAANRRHFIQLAEREIYRVQRTHSPLALLVMDIDHFKEINDSHGHVAGDAALCHLVAVCQLSLRRTDIIARFGGDEFVILLPECDPPTAIHTAERLRETVSSTPVPDKSGPFTMSTTIGVATCPAGSRKPEDLDALLRLADEALYEAKGAGRNRIATRSLESLALPTTP